VLRVLPVRLQAVDDALALQHADGCAVERDVDRRNAALDLAVVVDRRNALRLCGLLDRGSRAGVECNLDEDLRAVTEALVGLRLLLLRVATGVEDLVRDAGRLERGGHGRCVVVHPADRRCRVREQHADVAARGLLARARGRDGDCHRCEHDDARNDQQRRRPENFLHLYSS